MAVGMDGTGHFSPVVAFEINTTDASTRDMRGLIDIELVPAGRGAG